MPFVSFTISTIFWEHLFVRQHFHAKAEVFCRNVLMWCLVHIFFRERFLQNTWFWEFWRLDTFFPWKVCIFPSDDHCTSTPNKMVDSMGFRIQTRKCTQKACIAVSKHAMNSKELLYFDACWQHECNFKLWPISLLMLLFIFCLFEHLWSIVFKLPWNWPTLFSVHFCCKSKWFIFGCHCSDNRNRIANGSRDWIIIREL